MKTESRQSGVTLTEMAVVVAVAALLAALGLPAIRSFFNSLATEGSTKAMIGAALSSARAIAAERQRYAGVRFQKAYHPAGPLKASQYMIFIINDPAIGAYFFRAVEGAQPMKLPENLGVMDLIRVSRDYNPGNHQTYITGETPISDNAMIANQNDLIDTTAFSIIFSPSGKMVIHEVRVRNKNGFVDSTVNSDISYDDVFNKKQQVDRWYAGYNIYDSPPGAGMFYQDDYFDPDLNSYPDHGLGPEFSRNSFVVYEEDKFRQALDKGQPYFGYLYKLEPVYINPYTGTIIDSR